MKDYPGRATSAALSRAPSTSETGRPGLHLERTMMPNDTETVVQRAVDAVFAYERWTAAHPRSHGSGYTAPTADDILDAHTDDLREWMRLAHLVIERAEEIRGMSAATHRHMMYRQRARAA